MCFPRLSEEIKVIFPFQIKLLEPEIIGMIEKKSLHQQKHVALRHVI
jgi:hypothetical protein